MIVGVVGFIGAGKDTVSNLLCNNSRCRSEKRSFAGPLKDVCSSIFGWERKLLEGDTVESRDFRETPCMFWSRKLGIPNFTPRLALQLVGTDVLRNHFHTDIWLNSLEYRLRQQSTPNTITIISDARFRNELDLIKSMGGKIIWVQRGELPEWYDIAAEANAGNVLAKRKMNTTYRDVHSSEWDWAGYEVDFVIDNNGSMEDLCTKVYDVQDWLLTKQFKLREV